MKMLDMFPCTAGVDLFPCCVDIHGIVSTHVETVVLLSHKKPDGHINVKVEFGEGKGKVPLDNIAKRAESYKPKERVTYKMIKEYIEAKYGFKVHTAYIAEVKRDLGLPMYDAPNVVEELKQPRNGPMSRFRPFDPGIILL
ncbi:RNA methyltransferase [Ruminococcus sp. MCC718]|uniref:RNA methyltransferase n=1 Tax=Ruminococcus sp. MCC718 TaxID=2592649 RepID=UPI0020789BA7|nr:RNA methyltransferase [Ruminococcus sp. MCC718]